MNPRNLIYAILAFFIAINFGLLVRADPPASAPVKPGGFEARQREAILTELNKRMEKAQLEVRDWRARLEDLRIQLSKMTGRIDSTPEATRTALTRIEDELQRLEIERAGQEARQKALVKAIDSLAKEAKTHASDDAIAKQMEEVVVARLRETNRLANMEAAGIGPQDVDAAKAHLEEAKVALLERREVVEQRAGGDQLSELNRELTTLTINADDTAARMEYLQQRREQYRNVHSILDAIDDAIAQQAEARTRFAELRSQLDKLPSEGD